MAVCCLQFPNGKERKLEDLKARYYALAKQLLTAREGGEAAVANNVIVKTPYNREQERCAQALVLCACSATVRTPTQRMHWQGCCSQHAREARLQWPTT